MDPIILLYIAIGIIVLGLIITGIGVFMLIKGAKEPVKKMKGSADNLKSRMDNLMLETTHLQHTAAELSEDIQQKSEKVAVFVDGAKGTVNSVIDLNAVVRNITGEISHKVDQDPQNAAQVHQWSNTAVGVLSFIDKKKSGNSGNTHYNPEPAPAPQIKETY